jgi:hypothetical protein
MCVNPTASVDALEKTATSCPCPGIAAELLGSSARSIVTNPNTLSRFPYGHSEANESRTHTKHI